jgi:hypothetical protein
VALTEHAEVRPDALEAEGPSADGDPMGTPARDEVMLWKGRPNLAVLTRTAFHTRKMAVYFVLLIAVALAFNNPNAAIVCAVLGVLGLVILQVLAWMSARSTLYILTDQRLIMRIGMAIEARINIPLKHIGAAHLRDRGKGFGDIALELNGERTLGWLLLWPHSRPFRYANPQPMLRAIPDAQSVAELLAEACARHHAIERNLTEIKEAHGGGVKPVIAPIAAGKRAPTTGLSDTSLEGAPA